MALFVKQNEHRTELQDRIAAELSERIKNKAPGGSADVGNGILEESQEVSGRSVVWVGIVTVAVVALVVAVILMFS